MKKRLILGTLITLTAIFSAGIGIAQQNVLINSDKQVFDATANKTVFEGNVKVAANGVNITGKKAFVTLNEQGQPSLATITGNPEAVKINGATKQVVTANVLKVSLLDNIAEAEGNVKSVITDSGNPVAVITSEYQQFDKNTGLIKANTNVKIDYKDIKTVSSKADITLNAAGKPEHVKLTGNANLKQGKSNVKANVLDFTPESNELVASGSSYSQTTLDDGTVAHIWAGVQQMSKANNSLIASEKVKVIYQDYLATGPKAVFLPDKSGQMNKIVMRGMSTIVEGPRQVTASKIEITINPKNFIAEGGVKTKFTQEQKSATDTTSKEKTTKKKKEVHKKNNG
ncbi:MAG: LptA/OstA family protein [bacterium]